MDLLRLLAFDHWANKETARALHPVILPRAVAALAHMVAINELWLSRVVGGEVASAWPDWSVNLAANRLAVAFEKWSAILGALAPGVQHARSITGTEWARNAPTRTLKLRWNS